MNKINFNQSVGFPLETEILDKLQEAFMLLNAFGEIVGNLTIISGCEVSDTKINDGTVFINGELLKFRGGVPQSNVRIIEEIQQLEFEDTNMRDVIYTRYVTFGTATTNTYAWTDFKRGIQTKEIISLLEAKADSSALVAINKALNTITLKLDGIESNAQKNIQANYQQTDETKDDFIKGKPAGMMAYLYKGSHNVGDAVGVDSLQTVNFTNVGTNNYMVIGSMISNSSNYDNDNDVIWMIRDKQNASFKLALREVSSQAQNLIFEYILIPL